MHVVFGANGFIGSHIVDDLLAHGQEVAACVRASSDLRWLRGKPVDLRRVDLATGEGLEAAVRDATVIVNSAGSTRSCPPEVFHEVTQVGGERLARAAMAVPGLRRFVHLSSSIARGPNGRGCPAVETDPCHPTDPYGAAKWELERAIATLHDLPWVILRPSGVFGPRDPAHLPIFALASQGVFPMPGDGRRQVSLIHIDDAVRAVRIACEHPNALHRTYFITADAVDWGELWEAVSYALGRRPLGIHMSPTVMRAVGEIMELRYRWTGKKHSINRRKVDQILHEAWTCSGERAARELGFRASIHVREGFASTVAWYREQGWLPPQDNLVYGGLLGWTGFPFVPPGG